MPQVKIKQGTKSSINNNAGVLNAGTLAVTTDTNELFVTHNDGTIHKLCDNVNKTGDTMTGNLNMSGNSFERAGFEVVTSLPTTNNFVGRQVTYQGRSYIWNGSAWKCDSDTLGGYSASSFVTTNERQSISGVKIFGSDYITLNNEPLSNYAMGLRIPVRSALIHSFSINYLFNADLKSYITINAPNTNTYLGNPASLFNGDVYSNNSFSLIVNNISPSNPFVLEVSSNSVLLPFIERTSKFIFTEATGWSSNYNTGNSAFLNWKLEIQGSTDGLWYPLINRSGVEDKVNNLTIVGFPSNTLFATNGNREGLAFRLTVYEASPYSSPSFPYIYLSQILYFNSQSSAGGNLITERGGTILGDLIVNKTVQSKETINFNTNNEEPTQSGTVTKTSTWLWQYLVQSVNFLWLKIKTWVGGLFSAGSATTNNNYLPKIDDFNKKLVKSNIYDDGTTPKYGTNTIWHSGNSNFENSSISLSSGTDLNTLTSGKYHTSSSAIIASLLNCPVNTGELNLIVYNSGSNSYVFQELYYITQKTVYQRTNNGGTWSAWQKVWNSNNDGTSSGLDADLLDGKHLSEIVNGTTNYISKFTGTNSIGDSIIYATTDKVGIGTSNPSEKLEVVGNIETDHIKLNNSVTFLDNSVEKAGMRYNGTNKTIEFFFI